jgi:HlyD family secretion protein
MSLPKTLLLSLLPLLLAGTACARKEGVVLNGRVEAYLSDVGPRVPGRLAELGVQEGQRVKQGQLLARVSAEELDAAVLRDLAALQSAEAKKLEVDHGSRLEEIAQGEARVRDGQAALLLAEDTLKRARRLFQERITSQADLDGAQAARDRAAASLDLQRKALDLLRAGVRSEQRLGTAAETRRAKAVLDQTRTQMGFLEIRAPFDGLVIHRLREPGTVLAAGQPVLTLARLDSLWVRLYLPQTVQTRIGLGVPVTVETLDGRTVEGRLDEISSTPEYTPKMVETAEERVNLVYPARVGLPGGWDKSLVPGQAVNVRIKAPR